MSRSRRWFGSAAALLVLLGAVGCVPAGTPEPSPNAVSSMMLVESPDTYDGRAMTFKGEVIGEAMVRGDMAWLHLNDDAYYVRNVEEGAQLGGYNAGMAVWLPADEARKATFFGDYEHEGDIVEVSGTFNAACAQHGGDMDIHATTLTLVTSGHEVVDEIDPTKALWAAILAVAALVVFIIERLRRSGDQTRR